jgi:NitT/TauT family transport system substrate-binding protein
MNKGAQIILAVTVVIIVIIIATRIYLKISPPGNQTGPPEKATLSYVATTSAVLAGIALQQGYYQEEGLLITPRTKEIGKAALEDVLEGKADFGTSAGTPIMMAIMKGGKISILATIQTSNKYNAIVARKDSGILKPLDLKGKRIAVSPGTTSEFFMDAYLSGQGIAGEDFEKVYLDPEHLQDALSGGGGRVDAVSVFQPSLIRTEKRLGDLVVSFYDENIYTWTFNVVAKQEFVRDNPEKVKKLLRALVKAEDFVNKNPEEAQRMVADYSGMNPALIDEIWDSMKLSVTLNQLLVLALEDESRWAIECDIIAANKIPNYLDYIYFDGLEAVKPKAVRILR